jgi:O-antigen/teichoic acid export membrane protein
VKILGSRFSSPKFLVIGDQLLFSGTNFAVTVGLARLLGIPEFGWYTSAVLIIYLLISFGNAIIIQPFQVSGKKFQGLNSYSHFLFFSQLCFTVLMAIGSIAGSVLFTSIKIEAGPAVLFMAGVMMHDFFRKFYLASNQLYKVLLIDTTVAAFQGATFIALYLQQAGLNSAFLYLGLTYLPAFVFFINDVQPSFRSIFHWHKFFAFHKAQAGWLSLVSFIQWGSGNMLVAVSGFFLGLQALGAFRLVQSLFGVLNILFQSFENYVLPHASRIYSESADLSKKYIRKVSLQSALLIGAVLSLLFCFSTEIIELASAGRYTDYGYVVKGMCLLYLVLFMGYPVRLSIRLLLLNQSFFKGYLLSFLFSAVFFNVLLKQWHINGIIIGLAANQFIMIIYWTYQLNKQKFYLWK